MIGLINFPVDLFMVRQGFEGMQVIEANRQSVLMAGNRILYLPFIVDFVNILHPIQNRGFRPFSSQPTMQNTAEIGLENLVDKPDGK